MIFPSGNVALTGIWWTARSKISLAMVAANGARGVRAMEGQPTAVVTVMVLDPFLWLMVWARQGGQATKPEPDAMHPDQS